MNILTVYYTMYGHTFDMANAVNNGVASVEGVDAILRRVEEFDQVKKIIENDDFTSQVHAKQSDIPICGLDDLRQADGVIFGSPTRFGNMAAQIKQLFDAMGSLWVNGEMEGKPAGLFTSTATTHGGQETTLLTTDAAVDPPGDACCRRTVFRGRHDSYGSQRRHAVRRVHHRWSRGSTGSR